MPKETNIAVSNETKQLLKDFQKDVNAKSLEEAVKLAVGWGRSFNSNLLVSQVELSDRVAKLESQFQGLYAYLSSVLGDVLALKKEVKKLEEKQNVKE